MKKIIVALILLASLFSTISFAGNIIGVSPSIKTPDDVAEWFSNEFTYEMKFPDRPQTPEETMELKKGDCDDFAALASVVLSGLGIKNQIYIIKYRGLKIYHAVCVWQNKNGTYSMISTQALYNTNEKDVRKAIQSQYPDMENIVLSDIKRDNLDRIGI